MDQDVVSEEGEHEYAPHYQRYVSWNKKKPNRKAFYWGLFRHINDKGEQAEKEKLVCAVCVKDNVTLFNKNIDAHVLYDPSSGNHSLSRHVTIVCKD